MALSARRIGLFGGSFDPVHLAHLALARSALRQLGLDGLRWVPAGRPWQKAQRQLSAAEHRAAMVALLLEGEPRFELDRSELDRDGPSYTIDTVRAWLASEPGITPVLILGQDQYARLPTWHQWRELLGLVELAVAARAGQEIRAAAEVELVAHRMQRLDMPAMDISSTLVREQVLRGGDIKPMVGERVAGYIAQHHLYSEY
ncbi:nicotinate-nucleotide adenylyltransferase [Paucibacter sediminis]|uniref:Probable nicotinate-nucleotide adenylyltransferase n=1 Tax=Paucibacter sediminis TaxID=3019553 RepID=A0AA95SLK7_9BURK|nr:nicotinate-nucleotide adenylyltransferase [Paucibacter sp. S2-9]WIT10372.1 nicotinate-nucleotide adenylyltransferase [Paucibacter sp. S2-9]